MIFEKQLVLTLGHPNVDHYWTAWIYYSKYTDKSLSQEERLKQCIENFPLTYTIWKGQEPKQKVNYYNNIIKPKYLKLVPELKQEN